MERAVEQYTLAKACEKKEQYLQAYKHLISATFYAPTEQAKNAYLRAILRFTRCNFARDNM